jgi:hypothetical protein
LFSLSPGGTTAFHVADHPRPAVFRPVLNASLEKMPTSAFSFEGHPQIYACFFVTGDYARGAPKSIDGFSPALSGIPREAKSYDLLAVPRA